MYSYVARQPIFNDKLDTIGYELLFRDGVNNTFPEADADHATSRLLLEQFLGSSQDAIGESLGFVNFSHDSVIGLLPTLFPKEKIVVEVANGSEPSEELLWAIMQLTRQGYRIALDNFVPSPAWRRFLPYIDIIKFNVQALPLDKVEVFIGKLSKSKIEFIAQRVETYQEYHKAKQLGFKYYQGYFFSTPEMVKKKDITASQSTTLKLCEEIAEKEIDYRKLEKTFASDVSLSYRALRYVNSAATAVRISSIHQALAYLGEEKIRKFVSLVALASVSEDKPDPLLVLSVQRATFCELLIKKVSVAGNVSYEMSGSQAYLTGLFSLLDALLDTSMDEIVQSVSLSLSVREALTSRQGVLGKVLSLAIAYERAEWDKAAELSQQLGLTEQYTSTCFRDALPTLGADRLSA